MPAVRTIGSLVIAILLASNFLANKPALGQEGTSETFDCASNPGDTCLGQRSSQNEDLSQLPYKYLGNSFSGKFHRPSCKFAKVMSVNHVCLFHFRRQAIAAGQVPCRYCLPPNWKTVEAKLLPSSQSRSQSQSQPGPIRSKDEAQHRLEPLGTSNNL
jgi:hypothetical protein